MIEHSDDSTGTNVRRFSKFTRPDRSNYTPIFQKTEDNDALDIGWNEGVMSDGRVFRVEAWAQDGITCLTIFMPTAGIENMSNEQFAELLESEGLVKWTQSDRRAVDARPYTDGAGASMWSVNLVIGDEDQGYAQDGFRLIPYQAGAQPHDVDFRDIEESPDWLIGRGYQRQEENTTSTLRWVRYVQQIGDEWSSLRIRIAIEFHQVISDEPTLSYHQAHSYSFNGVRLEVLMAGAGDEEYDEEIGASYLWMNKLHEVEELARLLKLRATP